MARNAGDHKCRLRSSPSSPSSVIRLHRPNAHLPHQGFAQLGSLVPLEPDLSQRRDNWLATGVDAW